jgi:hypothetical protein
MLTHIETHSLFYIFILIDGFKTQVHVGVEKGDHGKESDGVDMICVICMYEVFTMKLIIFIINIHYGM